jgi:hypothetical protein
VRWSSYGNALQRGSTTPHVIKTMSSERAIQDRDLLRRQGARNRQAVLIAVAKYLYPIVQVLCGVTTRDDLV